MKEKNKGSSNILKLKFNKEKNTLDTKKRENINTDNKTPIKEPVAKEGFKIPKIISRQEKPTNKNFVKKKPFVPRFKKNVSENKFAKVEQAEKKPFKPLKPKKPLNFTPKKDSNFFSIFKPVEKKPDTSITKKKKTTKKETVKQKISGFSSTVGNNFIGKINDYDLDDPEYIKIKKNKKTSTMKSKAPVIKKCIEIEGEITLKELASKMSVKVNEVIKKAKTIGFDGDESTLLEGDILQIISEECGHEVKRIDNIQKEKLSIFDIKINEETAKKRNPIVAIVGHVDHGKTSLLDKIRKSSLTKKEAGGITQSIGAYSVHTKEGDITFIDTPGHAAFNSMRKRGVNINDITILVVSGTEGVKDQTVESIKHILKSKSKLIIAATKCDLPSFSVDKLNQELAQHEVITSAYGGDIEIIPVSSVTGKNIDTLLKTIIITADSMELKANNDVNAIGVVLESKLKDKVGVETSLLIQQGSLKTGDLIISSEFYGKIKRINNDLGKTVKSASAGDPIEVIGLSNCPAPGSTFAIVDNINLAKEVSENYKKNEEKEIVKKSFASMIQDEKPSINMIIKADTQGSVEALNFSLENLNQEHADIKIIESSVGNINNSDLDLAKISNSKIITFNQKTSKDIVNQAKKDNIEVIDSKIIYKITETIEEELNKLIKPIEKEVFSGIAKIVKIFSSSKIGNIAGCMVSDGKIVKNAIAKLYRKNKLIFTGKVEGLKRQKDDIKEAKKGFDCGILMNYNDIELDDEIHCYITEYERI